MRSLPNRQTAWKTAAPTAYYTAMPSSKSSPRQFSTRPRLWLIISGAIFLLAWFLPMQVKHDAEPIGYIWVVFLSRDWCCSWLSAHVLVFDHDCLRRCGCRVGLDCSWLYCNLDGEKARLKHGPTRRSRGAGRRLVVQARGRW